MFLELMFLFAKNMKFLTKGGIHCTSRSSRVTFILCSLVELREYDNIAADIMVYSMYMYVLLHS